MSKCILLCEKSHFFNGDFPRQVNLLSGRITPDNTPDVSPRVVTDRGIRMAIIPPNEHPLKVELQQYLK